MPDRFESARQKIERARKHANDLEAEVSAFWATDPCEVERIGDAMTGSYRVGRVDALPGSIPLIAGDAAHNIRSALDHFAFAVVPRPDRVTAFPVWSRSNGSVPNATQWQHEVDRRLSGASPGLIEAFLKLEAWETGHDSLLWAIHELDRVDKHRLLISVATANTRIGLHGDSYVLATVKKFSGFSPDQPLLIEPVNWTPIAQGTVLPNLGDGIDLDAITFTFDVTLGEPELLRGQSAVAQLRILAELTENLIRELSPLA